MGATITIYGGAGEIGGNQILIEDRGAKIWLDFGCPMSRRNRFFDDLMGPRTGLGIGDLLSLGLVPAIKGLYRRDLLPRAWAHLADGEPPLSVLLSHCHLDHSGYLSLLRTDVPVYSSLMTALLAKAIQDSRHDDLEAEVVYAVPREDRHGVLAATHYKKSPAQRRPFIALGNPSDAAEAFWNDTPAARGVAGPGLRIIPAGQKISLGPFEVRHYPVDHSVPGALAWAVQTSSGWVAYTGDFRLHGLFSEASLKSIEALARLSPAALICEATHPSSAWPASEEAVRQNSVKALRLCDRGIIVDFAGRNIERIVAFKSVAEELGRKLAITPRQHYLLQAASLSGEWQNDGTDLGLYASAGRIHRPVWERIVIEKFAGEQFTGQSARSRLSDLIIGLGFYDLPELIDLEPAGSTYLRSTSEVWNEEEMVNAERLQNWLECFGLMHIRGDAGNVFHSSGHADGFGLAHAVKTIGAPVIIPVHTERARDLRRLAPGKKLIVASHGRPIHL